MKLLIFFIFSFVFTQTFEDVIYLKDGSEVHGMIIEQKPGKYYKIKSGNNIFTYELNRIQKIAKIAIPTSSQQSVKSKIMEMTDSYKPEEPQTFNYEQSPIYQAPKNKSSNIENNFATFNKGATLLDATFSFDQASSDWEDTDFLKIELSFERFISNSLSLGPQLIYEVEEDESSEVTRKSFGLTSHIYFDKMFYFNYGFGIVDVGEIYIGEQFENGFDGEAYFIGIGKLSKITNSVFLDSGFKITNFEIDFNDYDVLGTNDRTIEYKSFYTGLSIIIPHKIN